MILGLGIDLCPVDRIGEILERQKDAFENRVYTETEKNYSDCKIKNERLAARWAAKEALIKAFGGAAGVDWLELEIDNRENGAPFVNLKGKAKQMADNMGVKNIHLSISHAGGQAVAVIVLEG